MLGRVLANNRPGQVIVWPNSRDSAVALSLIILYPSAHLAFFQESVRRLTVLLRFNSFAVLLCYDCEPRHKTKTVLCRVVERKKCFSKTKGAFTTLG